MKHWQKGAFFNFYLPTAAIAMVLVAGLSRPAAETVVPVHLQTVGTQNEEMQIEIKRTELQFRLATAIASTALYAVQLKEMLIAEQQNILRQIEQTDALIVSVRKSHGIKLDQIGGEEQYRQKIEQNRAGIAANWKQYFAQVPAARQLAMDMFNRETGWFTQYLKPSMCALPYVQAGTVPESALCQE